MTENLDTFASAYLESFDYSFDNQVILNFYPRLVLERLSQSGSLLELGLGHGISSSAFSGKFNRHVVLEGSNDVITQFKNGNPDSELEIICTLFEDYSPVELFDLVVAGFVLEHVDQPKLLMQKIMTWVKPSGVVVVAVPNARSLHRQIGVQAGLLNNMDDLSAGDMQLGHQRLYTLETLAELFLDVGVTEAEFLGLFLKPFTTNQLKKLNLSPKVLLAMCEIGEHLPDLCCALLAIGRRNA